MSYLEYCYVRTTLGEVLTKLNAIYPEYNGHLFMVRKGRERKKCFETKLQYFPASLWTGNGIGPCTDCV